MKKKKLSIIVFISIIIVLIGFVSLWKTGILDLWTNGIQYIASSTNKYSCSQKIIAKNYTVDINLSNLNSNIGKIIYDDGKCKIIVNSVYNDKSVDAGGYRIGFKSVGTASINGAELISGIKSNWNEHGVSSDLVAKMKATYKNHVYDCSVLGVGPGYNKGDYFSYYIFPPEAYKSGNITLNEHGVVTLTISNLCKSIWNKI